MKIAGASLNQTPLDWSNNIANIKLAIETAKKEEVDILGLPELCVTGYGCEDMFLFPWVADRALSAINEILPLTNNITVTLGMPVWFENEIYNTVCVVSNRKILGFQAKQKLPNYGVHYEQRWFTPWAKGKKKINIDGVDYQFGDYIYKVDIAIIGFEICEEAWNDDRPACRLVNQNVNVILNPSASHFALSKEQIREDLVVNSSLEFNCVYVYTNQLGNEAGRIIYDGDVIIAQKGKLLASGERLSKKSVCLSAASVDLGSEAVGAKKSHKLSVNQQFSKAVTLGMFDYLRKSKNKGFVLSLSGGADSSSILVLVAEMIASGIKELGLSEFLKQVNRKDLIDKVSTYEEATRHLIITAYQKSINSSDATLQSAKELAQSVGATFYEWSIDENVESAVKTIEKQLQRNLNWNEDDIALQNIQARSRSPLIWMLANLTNSILLTTSNRSEGSVGYTTMDGDSSGSLAPIAGINKSFLVQWLKWAEGNLGYSALNYVNKLTPSAELRPQKNDQTDEDDLMPYSILQQIEQLFVEEKLGPSDIYYKLKSGSEDRQLASYIIKFFRLWSRNQWKRERLAPSFSLSSYNIDSRSWFRFPILSSGFSEELKQLENILVHG